MIPNGSPSRCSTLARVAAGSSWKAGSMKMQAGLVAAQQVRAEDHAGVALVEERVVRPLRTGRAERAQPSGEHLAVGVRVVRLLVRRGRVLRQPDLGAELAAVPPRGALMAARGEQDRCRPRQGAERHLIQAYGVDEHAALGREHRLRARAVASDVAVADAPVPEPGDDLCSGRGDLSRFGHLVSSGSLGWPAGAGARIILRRGARRCSAGWPRLGLRRRARPRPAPRRPGRCPGSGLCGTGRGWRRGRPRSSPSGTSWAG